jgi:hypothetical protein
LFDTDLSSPLIGATGHQLRRLAVRAVNQLTIAAQAYPNGQHPSATPLAAFFRACVAGAKTLMPAADNIYTDLADGQVLTVPVSGTIGTKATLTVANGAVTGIALS